jgi:hypothetical protein
MGACTTVRPHPLTHLAQNVLHCANDLFPPPEGPFNSSRFPGQIVAQGSVTQMYRRNLHNSSSSSQGCCRLHQLAVGSCCALVSPFCGHAYQRAISLLGAGAKLPSTPPTRIEIEQTASVCKRLSSSCQPHGRGQAKLNIFRPLRIYLSLPRNVWD